MAGERELTTGLLSKEANFRLLVSGPVGVKEIERLIKKLELDKEILADQEDEATDSGGPTSQLICLGLFDHSVSGFHELDQPTIRLSYRRVGIPKAGAICLSGKFIELSGFL